VILVSPDWLGAVVACGITVRMTDAVGHGLQAALLAGLTVAALRNARRRRAGLLEQASNANRRYISSSAGSGS
jgi:hypothetical protein